MTGQDIQDKLDSLVADLQKNGKGLAAYVAVRDVDGTAYVLPLSCDANGVINNAELAQIQGYVNNAKPKADAYNAVQVPLKTASDAFKTASAPHQTLMDDAKTSRDALSAALEADGAYQTAKTDLDTARTDAAYVAARDDYARYNVSEIFGNLSDAKGKYAI